MNEEIPQLTGDTSVNVLTRRRKQWIGHLLRKFHGRQCDTIESTISIDRPRTMVRRTMQEECKILEKLRED